MKFKSQFMVLGAKGFRGTVEGTAYDSTKLYVVMDVSEKNGTEVGQNAAALPFGKCEEFDRLKELPFPLQAELEISATTKGYEVLSFRVLSQAASAPKA